MVSKYETVLRSTCRHSISRRPGVDDLIAIGTATGGGATTITDTDRLAAAEADLYLGAWVYIYEGTGIGQERYVSSSTTGGQLTVPTWTTNPDTTSKYEVHRKYRVDVYNEVIDAAHRSDRLLHRNILVYENLLTQGLIKNPLFNDWANGAALAPDDWTLSGAGAGIARVTDPVRRGVYAAKITNAAATAAALTQDPVTGYEDGDTVSVKAVVHAGTASRVTLKVDDGESTASSSDAHGGTGLELLSVTHTIAVSDTIPTVAASVEISAGDAIDAIVDSYYANSPNLLYRYPLDPRLQYVNRVYKSRGNVIADTHDLYPDYQGQDYEQEDWDVFANEAGNVLEVYNNPGDNFVIGVEGVAYPAMPSADTSELEVNVEILILKACFLLTRNDSFERDYQNLAADQRIHIPSNARRVGNA